MTSGPRAMKWSTKGGKRKRGRKEKSGGKYNSKTEKKQNKTKATTARRLGRDGARRSGWV